MTRPTFLLALAAACAALSLTPEAAYGQDGRIEGTVRVGEAPVDDADVSLSALGRRVRVDGAGRFAMENLPPGTYVLEAESPRWGRAVESVVVLPGQTSRIVLALEATFHLDELIVSAGAGATRRSEAYQPASVVTSRDLVARGEASLGETLANEPGVSSTFFGPGASRPIIRGIGGDRVRILEGGIGVGDASGTSPDHAVGVETRTAERIEIIRGPATLLYGSSAVGGVVNVLDGKIAREPPTQPLSGFVEVLGGTVADERTGSAAATLTRGPVVVHGSALWRDTDDYATPTLSGFGDGTLENSSVENRRISAGVSVVDDLGYLGIAFSNQRSDYGVPGGHHGEEHGEEEEEEEPVTIDLDQKRFDLEGALRFRGFVRNLKARFGVADYRHVELEGSEVGTTFTNDYVEGRLESEHFLGERFHGAIGAQYVHRDFTAEGEEAFVPPSTTRTSAVFAYEELTVADDLRVQGGLRFERQNAEATSAPERTDDAVSASLGLNWDPADVAGIALSASRSVKLPNAEELFSNGPHAATGAFEIGNPALSSEVAYGVDLTLHVHGDRYRSSASLFYTGFSDYIYQQATGAERDGLQEFRFEQADARFAGFEAEAELDVVEGDAASNRPHLSLELTMDYVSAELTATDEPLPRIPPFRFGGGANFRQGSFTVQSTLRRTTAQDRVGPFEGPTEGFTMLDASASYRFFTGGLFHDLTLVAANLTDTEARLHTSFLKDVAPLPGRELRLVYRVNF